MDFNLKNFLENISFPILENNGNPIIYLSDTQKLALENFKEEIKRGACKFKKFSCICGGNEKLLIAEKDRYGIPIKIYLCLKCSSIFCGEILDEKSLEKFYEKYYRRIYSGNLTKYELFYQQLETGYEFLKILRKLNILEKIYNVFEVGCSSGGILYTFKKIGKNVKGCDLDKDYLLYGRSKGLHLKVGGYDKFLKNIRNADLVILSHVLEHLPNPIEALKKVLKNLELGKYILIGLPSHYGKWNLIYRFQNAHIIQFFDNDFLKHIVVTLGCRIIYFDTYPDVVLALQKVRALANVKAIYNFRKNKKKIEDIIEHIKLSFLKVLKRKGLLNKGIFKL